MRKKYHDIDRVENIKRGERIRKIREFELKLNKSQMAIELGISPQFLGLVEDGRANLVYRSLRKLRNVSGHSTDYILYGLDDESIQETREYLKEFSEEEIVNAIEIFKNIGLYMKKQDKDIENE